MSTKVTDIYRYPVKSMAGDRLSGTRLAYYPKKKR